MVALLSLLLHALRLAFRGHAFAVENLTPAREEFVAFGCIDRIGIV